MRIVVQVTGYYDWERVPPDVQVTPADLKSGRAKPAANGGHLMKITKKAPTFTTCNVSEEAIIQRIIHEMMPNQGCVPHSRMEAVGQIMARQVMPDQSHPKFMTSFAVDCDDGPDEALFRKLVTPFTTAVHEASGQMLIDPEDMDNLVSKYMEKKTIQDHVDHLHVKFHVKKKAAPPAPAPAGKAVTP